MNPSAAEILAAVHEVKPQSKIRSPKEVDEQFYSDFGTLPEYGMMQDQMPADFKEAIKYAEQLQSKIFKEKR